MGSGNEIRARALAPAAVGSEPAEPIQRLALRPILAADEAVIAKPVEFLGR